MHIFSHKIFAFGLLPFLIALAFSVPSAGAFETSVYTERSLLAGDRPVVRAAVNSEGLYIIPVARLKSLGFNDPSKVRIYGYGGRRIDDVLSQDTYADDLPEVYSEYVEGRGVVFYAIGSGRWTWRQNDYWHYDVNPYTSRSYYFISEADSPRKEAEVIGSPRPGNNAATTFMDRLHYEQELVSPGEAGALLVGEDFRNTMSRNFEFELTDAAPDSEDNPGGRLECSFVANTATSGPRLQFSINGTTLESNNSDILPTTTSNQHYHGSEALARHTFRVPDSRKLTAGIRLVSSGGLRLANLNYLSISYRRNLTLPRTGSLCFQAQGTGAILAGAPETTRIWDVTDPSEIMVLDAGASGGGMQWSTPYNGLREYAAWKPDATLPEPVEFRNVSPQNLHAPREIYPQMVIVAPAAYRSASERLAALHAEDGLVVEIADPEQIYNEFSSGAPDPSGIRRYLKMLYDRSLEASPDNPLQYVLLFTRPTFDPRHLTNYMSSAGYPTIPSWMPRDVKSSLSDTEGFTTDDFIAMLEDGSGSRLGYDYLSIAVGRVPVTSAAQASSAVDKFTEYKKKARTGLWRHRYLFTADDEDNGIHLQQTESQIKGITSVENNQHFLRKIYLDSYERSGKQYPAAREDLFRYLEEGVVWWNFIGHANTTSWTGNGLLTFTDMNNMYLRHWPFLYTATCDFLRWDSNTTSGGEYIFMERYGGGIGAVSAVRPVYISDNGMLSEAMGRALAVRDRNGRLLTPGEIYRRAKNDIRNSRGDRVESSNRLRYVFMGDPALKLAIPDNIVTIDLPEDGSDIVLGTSGVYELSGRITDPLTGETLTDFNGTLSAELYDAERSVTTYGWGEGKKDIYNDYGAILVSTGATVENGVFTLRLAMPEATAQNYRPATLSLYASSTPQTPGATPTQAAGLFRELYVYGEAPVTEADTEAPKIDLLALNHHSFQNGSIVNPSPAIIAEISDNVGINTSTTGIGRQMNAVLDGKKVYSQISAGYTPYSDGRTGGSIVYTVEDLDEGAHTLTLRVWDTSGNKAERSIDFYVEKDKAPVIYRVYTDTNPASTVANFYISHDRPEAMATVSVTVYNLLGKPLWTGASQGPSDMFESVPVSWDLTDSAGRRVGRGIYIYRATIETESGCYETASQRIAVTSGE